MRFKDFMISKIRLKELDEWYELEDFWFGLGTSTKSALNFGWERFFFGGMGGLNLKFMLSKILFSILKCTKTFDLGRVVCNDNVIPLLIITEVSHTN